MIDHSIHTDASDEQLAELAEQLADRLAAGDQPGAEALLAEHPSRADELRRLLPAAQLMAELGRTEAGRSGRTRRGSERLVAHDELSGTLGDFRLLRQAGRGGMGIVYEAQQISLRRRVALKVLPMAGLLDDRHVQRFRNEAAAAAGLHHPNIVPVYSVGCERGVHYLAMQFIEGQTLAEVIQQARQDAGLEAAALGAISLGPLQATAGTATIAAQPGAVDAHQPPLSADAPQPETIAQAAASTLKSRPDRARYRTAARMIQQAAKALDYAHALGVVHRDIKPSNLLLDGRGNVWVADFGLAHLEGNASLTMTGDVMGTLRYMSPEQATGRRDLVDHRSDVYSLGLTLYELLALQPAFADGDRGSVLRRVIEEEPPAPRRLDPAIPTDLETVLLKATAKEPAVRYQTAGEFADDLRRFLANEPVRAKRPGVVDRVFKWSRRHRAAAISLLAVMLITTIVSATSATLIASAYGRETQQRIVAQEAAKRQRELAALAQSEADKANANYRLARHAVAGILTHLADEHLSRVPQLAPVRVQVLQEVEAFCDQLAELNPTDPAIYAQRARVRHMLGDHRGELADLEFLVEHWRTDPLWREQIVCFHLYCPTSMLRDSAQALRHAAEWTQLAPDDPRTVHHVIYEFSQQGRTQEALEHLHDVVRGHPNSAASFEWQANSLLHNGDAQAAMSVAETARRLGAPIHAITLANILAELGQEEQALRAIRPRGEISYQHYEDKGALLDQFDRPEEAIAAWDQAAALAPFRPYSFKWRGAAKFRLGRYDEALTDLKRSLTVAPHELSVVTWVAPVDVCACPDDAFRQGMLELATAAAAREGAAAGVWSAYGQLQAGLVDPRQARPAFQRAMELGDHGVLMHYWHALTCLADGDDAAYRDACREMLRRFGASPPGEATYFTTWTAALAPDALDDYGPALAIAQAAAEAQPESISTVKLLGAVHYRSGQFAAAAEQLEASESLTAPHPVHRAYARFLLAMTHHRLGNPEDARRWFEQATKWTDAHVGDPQIEREAGVTWNRRLTLQLLRDEAQRLLETAEPQREP